MVLTQYPPLVARVGYVTNFPFAIVILPPSPVGQSAKIEILLRSFGYLAMLRLRLLVLPIILI